MAVWLLSVSALGPVAADYSVNVALDHWCYRFIERFEAKGLLHGLGDGIKPFSRMEVAKALAGIEAAANSDLSTTEVDELAWLKAEFADELARLRGTEKPAQGSTASGGGLYRYSHADGEFYLDLLARQQTDLFSGRGRDRSEKIFRNRVGSSIRGQFKERIGFRVAFEQTREEGSRDYILRDDVFEPRVELPQLKGDLVDYHEGTAYLTFDLPFFKVDVGKAEARWGPAPGDNLGLSSNAPAYDMVRLKARLGAFKLVSISGFLRPCPDRPDSPVCAGVGDAEASYIVNGNARRLERDKYIAAHRVEVALSPEVDLGFQEVVIYGDRGPELTYLNPLMFYWAAQSYLGDKDNLMMGVDLDWHPGYGLRFYLAYVVDDLKKLKVFSDDFSNKFSLQTGVLWADPMGWRDTDLRAEYVRIEPWIYSHKFPVNTFRHFDAPLGHSLGPNSDQWQIRLEHRWGRRLETSLLVGHQRHGDNELAADGSIVNVGGDLHLGRRAGDNRDNKQFLAGNVSRRTQLGGDLCWRLLSHWSLALGYTYEWGNNVPLPPRWDAGVALPLRSGFGDGGQQHLRFEMRYRYL
jgi:hypothetical protein